VFHASHDGQRPSQRADSNPHPVQKYTDLALATSTMLRRARASSLALYWSDSLELL
jgi:hypothetical protein